MGAPRRKDIVASRRRIEDEGEEEGSVAAGVDDDSLSEPSIISDADDDADAEGSEISETGTPKKRPLQSKSDSSMRSKAMNGKVGEPVVAFKEPSFVTAIRDTEAMMNGMVINDEAEEIHFDNMGQEPEAVMAPVVDATPVEKPVSREETLIERRRREHEDYKKKREEDPAFVPNRGGFFMHDHRSAAPGQNGFRPIIRGRGRGGSRLGLPNSPLMYVCFVCLALSSANNISRLNPQNSGPADEPWKHDLHEVVAEAEPLQTNPSLPVKPTYGAAMQPKASQPGFRTPPPNRSFSRSVHIGNVQVRVLLSGMSEPIVFSGVPVKQYTRLPHHRPPLRRDKPVRISLPDLPPRFIFPAVERSFIFIPRALRPNQQGFGRGRGRGSFSTYGGLPSRRTSAYGGSNYTPSVVVSRRSSVNRAASREGFISPAGSMISRAQGALLDPSKPVVRLPPPTEQEMVTRQQAEQIDATVPRVNLPQQSSYPAPQAPLSRENRPESLPMHQPRPQKNVSVADIESPATMGFQPPQQQQQQPFHHQVPQQVNGVPFHPDPYPHSRHPSHPSLASGTPLSQIPERAIHAQPFQPFNPYAQPTFMPAQYPPQPMYYYPPPPAGMPPGALAPPFIPGHQYPYMAPPIPPQPQMQPPPPSTQPETGGTPSGVVAQERNGMVFYVDASQVEASTTASEPPPPPQGFTPMGYPPPQGFFYPPPGGYYPTQ